MKEEKYKTFKIGDRAVVFNYWNSPPIADGIITAQTDHFVEIMVGGLFSRKEWFSKENVEAVAPTK